MGGAAPAQAAQSSSEWKETILHYFGNGKHGTEPAADLTIDANGVLYGTASSEYGPGTGSVFKLVPNGSTYQFVPVHDFLNIYEGLRPEGGVITDGTGDIFGTTFVGGDTTNGNVFELVPGSFGYIENVIHNFAFDSNGCSPAATMIDANGVLFGTATGCGAFGGGDVFQLTPASSGFSYNIVYAFGTNGLHDGTFPRTIIEDPSTGIFYGTTDYGGSFNCKNSCGTVYSLTPTSSGYVETILYDFGNQPFDGFHPIGLYRRADGTLFGTTSQGGVHQHGTFFMLRPAGQKYVEQVLFSFKDALTEGRTPLGSLVAGADGTFYGASEHGGKYRLGSVFALTPVRDGTTLIYTDKVIHDFEGQARRVPDGAVPMGGLVADASGAIYGTTFYGGIGYSGGSGVVFKLSASAQHSPRTARSTLPIHAEILPGFAHI